MNSRHQKTLVAIFADPVNGNLPWDQIEALLIALGCRIVESSGSAITVEKGGRRANFHRPHLRREALRYWVKAVRDYLTQLGYTP